MMCTGCHAFVAGAASHLQRVISVAAPDHRPFAGRGCAKVRGGGGKGRGGRGGGASRGGGGGDDETTSEPQLAPPFVHSFKPNAPCSCEGRGAARRSAAAGRGAADSISSGAAATSQPETRPQHTADAADAPKEDGRSAGPSAVVITSSSEASSEDGDFHDTSEDGDVAPKQPDVARKQPDVSRSQLDVARTQPDVSRTNPAKASHEPPPPPAAVSRESRRPLTRIIPTAAMRLRQRTTEGAMSMSRPSAVHVDLSSPSSASSVTSAATAAEAVRRRRRSSRRRRRNRRQLRSRRRRHLSSSSSRRQRRRRLRPCERCLRRSCQDRCLLRLP